MNKNWKNIDKLITNSNRIVLSTHEKPDGDGLGSGIAFYYYLKNLKKFLMTTFILKFKDTMMMVKNYLKNFYSILLKN